MGLKAEFNEEVANLFHDIEDLLTSVVYLAPGAPVTAPGGVVTRVDTRYAVSVLIDTYNALERQDSSVHNTDYKFLLSNDDLGFVPTTDGKFEISTGVIANVIDFDLDPSESLYTIQVRK